jgi:predicted Zn-ribbon and HTH transcriptional regulator
MAEVTERLYHNNRQLCSTNMPSEQGCMREQVNQRRSAMAQTVRQMITDIILEGAATTKELSAHVRIPEKDVLPHLAHIRNSLRCGQPRLVVEPACCRACGFVFQKRKRLRKPGRCPACHHNVLEAPVFRIQASV